MFFDTIPAVVIAIASLIVLLFAIIVISVKRGWSIWTFWFIVYFILASLLTVYDINCLILGTCDVWSWLKSIFILAGLCFYVVAFSFILSSPNVSFNGSSGSSQNTVTMEEDKTE